MAPHVALTMRTTPPTDLTTVKKGAARLSVSEKALRLWLARGLLPRVKLGRSVRIPVDAIERLIEENTVPARPR